MKAGSDGKSCSIFQLYPLYLKSYSNGDYVFVTKTVTTDITIPLIIYFPFSIIII